MPDLDPAAIIEQIEELIGYIEDVEKLLEMQERIDAARRGKKPDGSPMAPSDYTALLGDIIECVIDKVPVLPGGVKDVFGKVVDAGADAFGGTVDAPFAAKCRLYLELRRKGRSHEEAERDLGGLGDETAAWFRAKYLEERIKEKSEDPDSEEDSEGEEEIGDDVYVYVEPVLWGAADEACCADPPNGQGMGQVDPVIRATDPVWTDAPPWARAKQLRVRITIRHECKLRRTWLMLWTRISQIGSGGTWGRLNGPGNIRAGKIHRITRTVSADQKEIYYDVTVIAVAARIIVRSTSRCSTSKAEVFEWEAP